MKKINYNSQEISRGRHKRILKRVREGNNHIRLRIKKTNLHIYLLTINDAEKKTLFSSSSLQLNLKNGNKENSLIAAKDLLTKLKSNNINQLVLDRGSHSYYGKIAHIADFLRQEGIKI